MSDIKDLWELGIAKGTRDERERIIELLEDECSNDWPKVIEMSLSNLIALIKGEQA